MPAPLTSAASSIFHPRELTRAAAPRPAPRPDDKTNHTGRRQRRHRAGIAPPGVNPLCRVQLVARRILRRVSRGGAVFTASQSGPGGAQVGRRQATPHRLLERAGVGGEWASLGLSRPAAAAALRLQSSRQVRCELAAELAAELGRRSATVIEQLYERR